MAGQKRANIAFIAIAGCLFFALLANIALQKFRVVVSDAVQEEIRMYAPEPSVPYSGGSALIGRYFSLFERARVQWVNRSKSQFPGYVALLEAESRLNEFMNRLLFGVLFRSGHEWIPLKSNIFVHAREPYYLNGDPVSSNEFLASVNRINALAEQTPDLPIYCYFSLPPQLQGLAPDLSPPGQDIPALLANALKVPGGYLRCDTLEEYYRLYFRTDHHWNFDGGYEAYRQIIGMMKAGYPAIGEPRPVRSKHDIPVPFFGSSARLAAIDSRSDRLFYGEVDLPAYTAFVRSFDEPLKELRALPRESPLNNAVSSPKYTNLYGRLFRGDHGLVEYHFAQNTRGRNLLVLADSMAQPIDHLIASHFDNAYFVDLRYLDEFNFREFVRARGVTDVLFLCGVSSLYSALFLHGAQFGDLPGEPSGAFPGNKVA